LGDAGSKNVGIDNAHGEWITFVDADDRIMPKKLELSYKAAIKNKAVIV
jgi:glycosyltransferase involved in cell wall biosynthesis